MEDQPVVSSTVFRISSLERELEDIKKQLMMYVPLRENELQLKAIHDTVERTEKQLESVSAKLIVQEIEMQKREASLRSSQANMQIKILWGTVSAVIGLLSSILVGYVTHLFH